MDNKILEKLYSNHQLLDYLRYNPKWYRVLQKDPNNYSYFEKTAKEELKITLSDQVKNLSNQINFISSIINYINNG